MADQPTLPVPPFPPDGLSDAATGLRLRIWEPARDAPDVMRLYRDPDNDRFGVPFFVPRPIDVFATRTGLERQAAAARAGAPASFPIVDGDQVLGDVAWRLDSPAMFVADLGYGVLPEARGRGVARTALRLLTDWLLDDPDGPLMPRAQLDHATANIASCHVAQAAGFAQEGIRRGFLPMYDPDAVRLWTRHDICMHGRLPARDNGV